MICLTFHLLSRSEVNLGVLGGVGGVRGFGGDWERGGVGGWEGGLGVEVRPCPPCSTVLVLA